MRKKQWVRPLLGLAAMAVQTAACAAPDVAAFLKSRGWDAYEVKRVAALPDGRIAPVMYFSPDAKAPGCGLLQEGQPRFIEILAPEGGEIYPQCAAISDAAAFDMGGKQYVVIQYTDRETREDSYEQFFYVRKEDGGAYVADKKLNAGQAPADGKPARPVRIAEGIRQAKAAHIQQAFAGLEWQPRDFIADQRSAFGIFKDKAGGKCVFAVESAGKLARYGSEQFSGAACREFVASGKLEKDGRIYYLGLYDSGAAPRQAAIFSVPGNGAGEVRLETALAAASVKAGAAADVKSLKKYLAAQTKP